MEVERTSFPAVLPSILKHISNAHFISFDLELSGIPTQKQRINRQTVEERYLETKKAAETFHILQVGLTLVEEDVQKQRYVMRSYNFNISPLVYEGLDFERDFTYSSGAVDFLLRQNYQMDSPFFKGVPYLTKSEADIARERTRLRWDRDAIPDIKISSDNLQAVEFMKRVRTEVDSWKKTRKPHSKYHDIVGTPPSTTTTDPSTNTELNRFERRLVHQIIRGSYKDLQTFSEKGYVRIRDRDIGDRPPDEDGVQRRLNRALFHQTGFRWVAEAMAGDAGDLTGIDPGACARQIDGETPAAELGAFVARLDELRAVLKSRQTVLVGHNCLLDLVYFYKNFYGELPDTLDEFKTAIRGIFPVVIDTKYMATTGSNYYAFRSFPLSQLDEALSTDEAPVIDYAEDHPQYTDASSYHEAGYDSFVTAKIFLRFAMRLQAEERQKAAAANMASSTTPSEHEAEEPALELQHDSSEGASTVFAVVEKKSMKKKSKAKGRASPEKELSDGKFFSGNIYEALQNLPTEHNTDAARSTSSDRSATTNGLSDGLSTLKLDSDSAAQTKHANQERAHMIPSWNSNFWQIYGNKLRMYGTLEEMCDLTEIRRKSSGVGEKIDGGENEEGKAEDKEEQAESIWSGIGKAVRSFF